MRTKPAYLCKAIKTVKRFARQEDGLALLEFAISVGMLIMVFMGSVEVSRYVLIFQKLQNTVNDESNIITTINPKVTPTMTAAEMNAITSAAGIMMDPYTFNATNSKVILTDIYAPITSRMGAAGAPVVKWRWCSASTLSSASVFGRVNANAQLVSLPNGFTMAQGDEIVAAEVYYNYAPMVTNNYTRNVVSSRTLYNVSISVPRYGALINVTTSNCQ